MLLQAFKKKEPSLSLLKTSKKIINRFKSITQTENTTEEFLGVRFFFAKKRLSKDVVTSIVLVPGFYWFIL